MARVKGPLMSLAASGTFRGLLEFRSGQGRTIVAGTRTRRAPRSPAQLHQQTRMASAMQAWRALDAATQATWKTKAASHGGNGYRLYLSEYLIQNIDPPDQPELPP